MEAELLELAARGVADPGPLFEHALARANVGGPTIRTGVDWLHEGAEEGADWANYLRWFMEEQLDSEASRYAGQALRHVLLAYDAVQRAREALTVSHS